jgi:sugar phosphate isomerase/epimerase
MNASRRQFLASVAGAGITLNMPSLQSTQGTTNAAGGVKVCYFSKHLQWLDWEQMAQTAAELGFDGVDLTVRRGGHVLPERVAEDLPKVAKIVGKAGLEIPMISAGIADTRSPHVEAIVRTASELGIPRYRWGWFSWSDSIKVPDLSNFSQSLATRQSWLAYLSAVNIPDRLDQLKKRVASLAELNQKYKMCAMYHNHSGSPVGASVWDLWILIKDFDTRWVSSNIDIGHATVEGGLGGWVNSSRLMAPYIRGTAIKDFKWGKNANGEWEPLWCPLGEGMVNFRAYFAMLKKVDFSGPVQLHTEYPLGGVEAGARTLTMEKSQVLETIRRDVQALKGWLREAELI